jgi:UDP-glucose 4-epimerase
VIGDLRDADVLAAALEPCPETIFHLAARTSVLQSVGDPQGVYDVNVALTQQLLESARRGGTRSFVFASTNAVVGETDGALIDEATPLAPLTPYGATKAAAEMLCAAYASSYGLRACSVRFTNVYGPGMGGKDTLVVRMMRAAAAVRPMTVYGDGHQERDYLHVDDAVAAMVHVRARDLAGPVTIGTGVSSSVLAVRDLAAEVIGLPITMKSAPAPPGEMRAVRVDISKARSVGFAPAISLREGLASTWDALQPELEFARTSRRR